MIAAAVIVLYKLLQSIVVMVVVAMLVFMVVCNLCDEQVIAIWEEISVKSFLWSKDGRVVSFHQIWCTLMARISFPAHFIK